MLVNQIAKSVSDSRLHYLFHVANGNRIDLFVPSPLKQSAECWLHLVELSPEEYQKLVKKHPENW